MSEEIGVSSELFNVLHNKKREAEFLSFLESRYCKENYVVWSKLTELLELLRNHALNIEPESKKRLTDIHEKHLHENAVEGVSFPIGVKLRFESMMSAVGKSFSSLDVRVLLDLQKEAELLLLPDIKTFCLDHPFDDEDESLNRHAYDGVFLVGITRIEAPEEAPRAGNTTTYIDLSSKSEKKGGGITIDVGSGSKNTSPAGSRKSIIARPKPGRLSSSSGLSPPARKDAKEVHKKRCFIDEGNLIIRDLGRSDADEFCIPLSTVHSINHHHLAAGKDYFKLDLVFCTTEYPGEEFTLNFTSKEEELMWTQRFIEERDYSLAKQRRKRDLHIAILQAPIEPSSQDGAAPTANVPGLRMHSASFSLEDTEAQMWTFMKKSSQPDLSGALTKNACPTCSNAFDTRQGLLSHLNAGCGAGGGKVGELGGAKATSTRPFRESSDQTKSETSSPLFKRRGLKQSTPSVPLPIPPMSPKGSHPLSPKRADSSVPLSPKSPIMGGSRAKRATDRRNSAHELVSSSVSVKVALDSVLEDSDERPGAPNVSSAFPGIKLRREESFIRKAGETLVEQPFVKSVKQASDDSTESASSPSNSGDSTVSLPSGGDISKPSGPPKVEAQTPESKENGVNYRVFSDIGDESGPVDASLYSIPEIEGSDTAPVSSDVARSASYSMYDDSQWQDHQKDSSAEESSEAARSRSSAIRNNRIFENNLYDFNMVFQQTLDEMQDMSVQSSATLLPAQRRRLESIYSALIRCGEDFVKTALTYAKIIINERYLNVEHKTIKPSEDFGGILGGQKYVVHKILYKFAIDVQGIFKGRDDASAKVAGHELKGLKAYYAAAGSGLHFPLMALIDYKGFRLVAVSLLPLERGSLIYGSDDAGLTVQSSEPKLNLLIEAASRRLNLKPHACGSSNTVVYSPVDLEGHRGKDGRFYLLDFSRVFPPMTPSRDIVGGHLYRMFRAEFLATWMFPLCSDAYSRFVEKQADKKQHSDEVDTATKDLLGITLSNFSRELAVILEEEVRMVGKVSHFRLTEELHRKGINMRYLGLIVARLGRFKYAKFLVAHMCARVIKGELRAHLRKGMEELKVAVDEPYRMMVTDYLNTVFGNSQASRDHWSTVIVAKLDQRFSLRAQNWRHFPKNLKEWLWSGVELRKGMVEDLRLYLFQEVQKMTGVSFSMSLQALASDSKKELWNQDTILDDTDVVDIGAQVKHLDIMSKARGRVFTMRGEEKMRLGYITTARQLFCSSLEAFETALSGSPLDAELLRSCANTLLRIALIDHMHEGGTDGKILLQRTSPVATRVNRYFVRAIQANPADPFSHLSYAKFLVMVAQNASAEDHFLQALTLEPNTEKGLLAYVEFLRHSGGNEQDAQMFLARALLVRSKSQKRGLINDPK